MCGSTSAPKYSVPARSPQLSGNGEAPVTATSDATDAPEPAWAWIATPKWEVPRVAGFSCAGAASAATDMAPARMRTRRAGSIVRSYIRAVRFAHGDPGRIRGHGRQHAAHPPRQAL